MKKMKYLLYRTKKQKTKIQNSINNESHYLIAMKNQAIKSLQDFQQDCLNKTQLNITLTTTERPVTQHRSKSERKENMRRTFVSQQTSTKKSNFSKKVLFEASSLNIRKLLRMRTEVEQSEVDKLKNPFYKIQKIRAKRFSMSEKIDKSTSKQQNSLCLIKKSAQQQTQNKVGIFISREKKDWYSASRKFRSRTLQHDQSISGCEKREEDEKKISCQVMVEKNTQEKSTPINEKQVYLLANENLLILEPNHHQNLQEANHKITTQQSTEIEQSSSVLRERSLTVKYNQIKDYFQKKYNKGSTHEYEEDYLMQKFHHDS